MVDFLDVRMGVCHKDKDKTETVIIRKQKKSCFENVASIIKSAIQIQNDFKQKKRMKDARESEKESRMVEMADKVMVELFVKER